MTGLNRALVALLVLVLAGCSGSGSSRYSIKHDHGPSGHVDLSHVPDAVPRDEPKSRGGNKSPYKVFGKKYYVMDSAQGYKQRGTASWYGKKFHGHKTSNGEVYDMYAMSAAHKALPLPTYVRVTNLANGRQVIVRVNDRGPFHGSRLIDLSYAAAYKLDMLRQGTAKVEVEAISSTSYRPATQALHIAPVSNRSESTTDSRYIQVGAYSSWSAAQSVKTRIELMLKGQRVDISKREGVPVLYRVRLGPLKAASSPDGLLSRLAQEGFGDAQVLDLP